MKPDLPTSLPGGGNDADVGGDIEVTINGQSRALPTGTTVAQLIVDLGFGDQRVAVERNRQVVPRKSHATTQLGSGDRLEIVTFVGGGA